MAPFRSHFASDSHSPISDVSHSSPTSYVRRKKLGTKNDTSLPVTAPKTPQAPRPARKPIRLTDLAPRLDVKGGQRTVFGASTPPPKDNTPKRPAK